MRILMVSMPSLHFFRWANQLKDAGHEVYWFDIKDGGQKVSRIDWIRQITGWKLKYNYPGRYFIKNKLPQLYKLIQKINEHNAAKIFEQHLLEIKPDAVHSFALYVSCSPIISVMEKYTDIKWIYSSWGSDLFYFQHEANHLKDIQRVLPRVNYLFTDCQRDYQIAKKYGFTGEFLGVYPGGGGFHLETMEDYALPLEKRKTILIKGFQGRSGRAIPVLKAVEKLKTELRDYTVVVFGADSPVYKFLKTSPLKQWNNIQLHGKMTHEEVLKLMGASRIYIGNSNSDGIPNTLLEAICMNVFPIQSNPGNVTEEIIVNGLNGLLIEDCEDISEIKKHIETVLSHIDFTVAQKFNENIIKDLSYSAVQAKVLQKYADVDRLKI